MKKLIIVLLIAASPILAASAFAAAEAAAEPATYTVDRIEGDTERYIIAVSDDDGETVIEFPAASISGEVAEGDTIRATADGYIADLRREADDYAESLTGEAEQYYYDYAG